ncbi:hypothetical protein [Spiroplasma endosymbiont of Amphimallon solstitiale]|uniref:hypothetical protein n=1 Tax=Spiroplasma endosymbiont of Amphimallon solstitiale TaxID=3066288 RepID=UPI00313CB678
MPTESQEIGSDNKKQKNIKDFRKEIISKITSTKIERKYCKQLIKTINSDDLTIFFNSLIKADSLFWFLNIVHYLYQELFSLYNNKKFLVFDELLLENLNCKYKWDSFLK